MKKSTLLMFLVGVSFLSNDECCGMKRGRELEGDKENRVGCPPLKRREYGFREREYGFRETDVRLQEFIVDDIRGLDRCLEKHLVNGCALRIVINGIRAEHEDTVEATRLYLARGVKGLVGVIEVFTEDESLIFSYANI